MQQYRDKTNSDLLDAILKPPLHHSWPEALAYLHILHLQPPPTRASLYNKTSYSTKHEYWTALHKLHLLILATTPPLDDNNVNLQQERTASPFWKIALSFETIILGTHDVTTKKPNKIILQRLQAFRNGDLKILYQAAFDPNLYHATGRPPTFDNANLYSPAAQEAADQDNYKTAHSRIQSQLPVALLTPERIAKILTLYPPRLAYTDPTNPTSTHTSRPNTRNADTLLAPKPIIIDNITLARTLKKMARAKAAGPFASSTDPIQDYALFTSGQTLDGDPLQPHLSTMRKIVNVITAANIPADIRPYISGNYFTALHKDKNNHENVRPLGIGTAYRRVTAASVISAQAADYAEFLLPQGQFGINIPSGLDYIIHSTYTDLERFVTFDPDDTSKLPTRAVLFLDIANMFNAISRDACRSVLQSHPVFKTLLPLFDLLYKDPNVCWYQQPDGTFASFLQHEGFAQGCPLSGFFAAIVLNILLIDLNTKLKKRAHDRRTTSPGDDGQGSLAASTSFVDDSKASLAYLDLVWYITEFSLQGIKLGIRLAADKTFILTSTTGLSPLPYLSPADATHLSDALTLLTPPHRTSNPELTLGIRHLGQPAGGMSFASSFLTKAATSFNTQTSRLTTRIHDTQTQSTLFRACTLASTPHLLAADVLYNSDLTLLPPLNAWHSTFTNSLADTTERFLRHVTRQEVPLPPHSIHIAQTPASLGGTGHRDPNTSAIPSFILPFARSIHYASTGIPLADGRIVQLSSTYTRTLAHWKSSRLKPFILVRHYLPEILPILFPKSPPTPTQYLKHTPKKGGLRKLYHHFKQLDLDKLPAITPIESCLALPSILSPHTSLPLHSLSRRHSDLRLRNDLFSLALCRKLDLPIIPIANRADRCPCGAIPDPKGHHFFKCRTSIGHKAVIHNKVRNSLFYVAKELAPLAEFTYNDLDVHCEPRGLLPVSTTKRPADIGLKIIPSQSLPHQHSYMAIDVTIPPTPSPLHVLPPDATLSYLAEQAHVAHHGSTRSKFIGRSSNANHQEIIQEINQEGIYLIPFTIDEYGGLGYFANRFLYGPKHKNGHTVVPKPPWATTNHLAFPHRPASDAYSFALLSPQALLPTADANWLAHKNTHFGHSYHSHTPSQWATQILGLNIVHAYASHLARALASLTHSPSRPPPRSHDSRIIPTFLLPKKTRPPTRPRTANRPYTA